MWFLIARALRPDAPYWRGRRALSALDALVWPMLWAIGFAQVPQTGIVAPIAIGVAIWCAASRVRTAVWHNHRYRFTTWRWAKVLAFLVLVSVVLKAMMSTPMPK